jgi:hypothetical protein
MTLTLTLSAPLAAALQERAALEGLPPEVVADRLLRAKLLPPEPLTPIDEWERRLFGAAIDCGVSVPDYALSSQGLYE